MKKRILYLFSLSLMLLFMVSCMTKYERPEIRLISSSIYPGMKGDTLRFVFSFKSENPLESFAVFINSDRSDEAYRFEFDERTQETQLTYSFVIPNDYNKNLLTLTFALSDIHRENTHMLSVPVYDPPLYVLNVLEQEEELLAEASLEQKEKDFDISSISAGQAEEEGLTEVYHQMMLGSNVNPVSIKGGTDKVEESVAKPAGKPLAVKKSEDLTKRDEIAINMAQKNNEIASDEFTDLEHTPVVVEANAEEGIEHLNDTTEAIAQKPVLERGSISAVENKVVATLPEQDEDVVAGRADQKVLLLSKQELYINKLSAQNMPKLELKPAELIK